jgi:hypothetical protein
MQNGKIMKLKIWIIFGIGFYLILWYCSYFSNNFKPQMVWYRHNVVKILHSPRLPLLVHSIVQESSVAKTNQYVKKQSQLMASKSESALLYGTRNNSLSAVANDLLTKNSEALTNYIIPIVDTSQNSSSNALTTEASGMGGGGAATVPVTSNTDQGNKLKSTIVYISLYGGNNVMSCDVIKTPYNLMTNNGLYNNSGETPTGVTNCTTIFNNTNSVESPDNLLINNNNLYVANSGNSSVTSCNLSKSGGIDTCNSFSVSIEPVYITQAAQNQLYIYSWPNLANIAPAVSCVTDNNGNIINCGNPTKINVALLPYPIINNYTYTTNFNNNGINKCSGTNCQILNNILMPGQANGPTAVVATSNNVYIVNYNSLVGCGIDKNSGNFFNCKVLNSNLNDAEGVATYNVTSGS